MVAQAGQKRIYLLTVPRCGSHLLQRILSSQPRCDSSDYHLFSAWLGSGFAKHYNNVGPLDTLRPEERDQLDKKFQVAFEKMLAQLDATEKAGRSSIIKEHVVFLFDPVYLFKSRYPHDSAIPFKVRDPSEVEVESASTSPCCVPDTFLLSFQPIFQIRHPALMFPSAARAMRDTAKPEDEHDGPFEDILQNLHWSRELYEWYVSRGVGPLVVDADDVMNEDRAAMHRLCETIGLDSNQLLYEWEPYTGDNGFAARFKSTLNSSKGIIRGLTAQDLHVETEKRKWKAEFGDKWASSLARRVQVAMKDYEWLRARRV